MPKPKKAEGRVVKMSPLTIARIEAELLALATELKARIPDMTPVTKSNGILRILWPKMRVARVMPTFGTRLRK